MLLQRTNSILLSEKGNIPLSSPSKPDDPLTCMIYFFASQMSRNLQPAPLPSGRGSRQITATTPPVHRLDTLLNKVAVHASFSPLITQFETFPVEIPDLPAQSRRWRTKPPKEAVHDTMLLVKFRSKRAQEEWIETREWREFIQQTAAEDVFRRIPHVRCARSQKGLSDPFDILSA